MESSCCGLRLPRPACVYFLWCRIIGVLCANTKHFLTFERSRCCTIASKVMMEKVSQRVHRSPDSSRASCIFTHAHRASSRVVECTRSSLEDLACLITGTPHRLT